MQHSFRSKGLFFLLFCIKVSPPPTSQQDFRFCLVLFDKKGLNPYYWDRTRFCPPLTMTYPYKKREPQKGLPKQNNELLLKHYMNNAKKFIFGSNCSKATTQTNKLIRSLFVSQCSLCSSQTCQRNTIRRAAHIIETNLVESLD